MGSLTSSPKAPKQQAVLAPAPQVAPTLASTAASAAPSSAETAAESREQSLLSRKRGRFGTIATGFQGFLGETQARGGRKMLLGE